MRFAVVIVACVLAIAHAQNNGRYNPGNDGRYNAYNPFGQNQYNRYNQNQYNPFNNNRYNPYGNYNRNQNYNAYKPYVTSTPFPRPSVTVTAAPVVVPKATPAPVVVPIVPVVTPAPVVPVVPVVSVAAKVAADSRSAETVKFGNEINPDGSYSHFFETNNGIAAQATGTPRNFGGNPPVVPDVVQGSFSWYSPEGQLVSITYTADENGYQPQGDAIPQPPPLPDQIARAFAYIAKNAPVAALSKV